ncbi:MAG: hypothetical protein M3Y27_11425 [Acidobacteriota bacterium]|nr:hypothetical protein [Acidobacteriota bacterium]
MSKPVIVGIIFITVVLAVLLYSTMNLAKFRVEVCVTFNGRSDCRIASADTEEHALRTATSNACGLLASGVTDSLACEHSVPTSVRWLKK